MTLTAGSISLVSKTPTSAKLSVTAASGGTDPTFNQWYRSLSSGFTPGAGNIIPGATGLVLQDSGLSPGVTYYYKVVQTDSAPTPATVIATQLAVTADVSLQNPNQFVQAPYPGMPAFLPSWGTLAAVVDASESGTLVAGQFVKLLDVAGPVKKVVACDDDEESAYGVIAYNAKNAGFVAGMACEVLSLQSCVWLYAAEAIACGEEVVVNVGTVASVAAASGHSDSNIVGWAYDKASAAGQLIRVWLTSPTFKYAP